MLVLLSKILTRNPYATCLYEGEEFAPLPFLNCCPVFDTQLTSFGRSYRHFDFVYFDFAVNFYHVVFQAAITYTLKKQERYSYKSIYEFYYRFICFIFFQSN